MNLDDRIMAMPPLAQRAVQLAPGTIMMALVLGLMATTSCSGNSDPVVPAGFELTSKTVIDGRTILTARDTGTGCEIIVTANGVMPRNERSADGNAVKQRCVLTGTEQSTVTGVTTTVLPADPSRPSAADAQAADVAAAIRDATAPAPTGREIPPPTGKGTRPKAVPAPARTPAPDDDGVESQLKN